MTEEAKIFSDISNILDEVASLSKGLALTHHKEDDRRDMRIWEYHFNLPQKKGKKKYYFLLPAFNSTVSNELISSFNNYEYCIIDCFKKFEANERATDPRLFYINFLFNSKGYNDFFDNNMFTDIVNLYTKRTVNFFYDADSFKAKNSFNLENLFDEWQKNGKKALLILGERGIGKSWSVLNYCLSKYKLHRENPWQNPLPIYLNLRALSENIPGVTNLGELIFYHLVNQYKIEIFGGHFLFSTLLRQGKIILVFDGLDEMSKEVSRELTIKNIWQLFSVYSNTSKFILTSRINFFSSRMQIFEHFAYTEFTRIKALNPNYTNGIYNIEERRVRQDFNVWEIAPMNNDELVKLLNRAENLKDEQLDNGLKKLIRLEKTEEGTLEKELYKLSDTPGYFLYAIKLLASNRFPSLVDIYEQCINRVMIEFNIESDRAINKYKTLTRERAIEGHSFEAEEKNEILRKLAWYMIEREVRKFDIEEFPKFIKEIEDVDFEVVLNDLQTQTVITLHDEKNYSFVSESIFAFYVANYLFYLLTNPSDEILNRGIKNLGKYDFIVDEVLLKANIFLKAKIKTLTDKFEGKENTEGINTYNKIVKNIENVFQTDRAYSPWLKYLSSNAKLVGLNLNKDVLLKHDHWNSNPISSKENSTDKRMVLIPGNDDVAPFFLGTTEITNKDYNEFLYSNEFDKDANGEDCLGHHWLRSEVFGDTKKDDNPYSNIINYYHIIFWTGDKIPEGKQNHPVVWLAWFAAAKFCNYLSRKEKLKPFYKFEFKSNKFCKLTVDRNASGYRLPTEIEWWFAASQGNMSAESLLDFCMDVKEKNKLRKKFFSNEFKTTSSVKSENPNNFGVYGLMGNVREWVDNPEVNELTEHTHQLIKGMGWLLGEEGFKFNHKTSIMAQNNNVDVGFRIARSLSKEEVEKVKSAYSKN